MKNVIVVEMMDTMTSSIRQKMSRIITTLIVDEEQDDGHKNILLRHLQKNLYIHYVIN